MKRVVMRAVGSTDPGTLLLTEHARLSAEDRVLVLSAGDPALILNAGRRTASVAVYDISYSALQRAQAQVRARLSDAPITFSDSVFPDAEGRFDVALMTVPKGRDFARAQLWSALKALRPGGRLYIAGPTQGGARSVLDDAAALFGHSVTLNTKRRYRIGVAVRPERREPLAYPTEWGADPTFVQQRIFETPCGPIPVVTMPGLFSWEHLDDGTAFLMEHVAFEPGQDVLDVGSGNGVLGIAAALSGNASGNTSGRVTLTDDNLLAVRCARSRPPTYTTAWTASSST
jgi:16S rRNA (guanine1207-N2)-methyltransferase